MPRLVLEKTEFCSLANYNFHNSIFHYVTFDISPVIDLLISLKDKFQMEDNWPITQKDVIRFLRAINDPNCIFVLNRSRLQIITLLASENEKYILFHLYITFVTESLNSIYSISLCFFNNPKMSTIIYMITDDGDLDVIPCY